MDILPYEIVEYTTQYLDCKSLYNFSMTCHRYNFSNVLKRRLKIEWTNSQKVIEAFINACKCNDILLMDYIFKRIEALLYIEADTLTANMLVIYKDDVIALKPELTPIMTKFEQDVAIVDMLVYQNMFT